MLKAGDQAAGWRVCKEGCMRNLVIGLGRTRAKGRRSSARVEGCKEIGLDDTDAKRQAIKRQAEGCVRRGA